MGQRHHPDGRRLSRAAVATPEILDDGQSVRVVFLYPGAVPVRFRHLELPASASRVLAAVAEVEPASLSQLVEFLGPTGISERTVRRALLQLKEVGATVSVGTGRGARWGLRPPEPPGG